MILLRGKQQSCALLVFCDEKHLVTQGFPSQMTSNANISTSYGDTDSTIYFLPPVLVSVIPHRLPIRKDATESYHYVASEHSCCKCTLAIWTPVSICSSQYRGFLSLRYNVTNLHTTFNIWFTWLCDACMPLTDFIKSKIDIFAHCDILLQCIKKKFPIYTGFIIVSKLWKTLSLPMLAKG